MKKLVDKRNISNRPFLRAYEVDYNNGEINFDGVGNDIEGKDGAKKKFYQPVTISKVPQNKEYADNGMTNDVKDRVENHKRTWVMNGKSVNHLIGTLGSDETKWNGKVSCITRNEEIKKDGEQTKQVKTIYAKGSVE